MTRLPQNKSVLSLSNSTAFSEILGKLVDRFRKLWKKKVYVHHYTKYIDEQTFTDSEYCLESLRKEYAQLAEEGSGGLGHKRGSDIDERDPGVIKRYKPLF